MSQENLPQLSRRERQIMDILFEHRSLSARAVTQLLPDAPSYTTVRTLLRILEEKGHLKHRTEGRQFIYETVIQPEKERGNRLQHILKTFFGGSISEAVATFMDESDTQLSKSEIAELEALVEKAKRAEDDVQKKWNKH